ncbi:hypothetical protein Tco_0869948, partial [Tanacetum coccineum]
IFAMEESSGNDLEMNISVTNNDVARPPVAQPGQQIPLEDLAAHVVWVKGQKEVVVLMLLTMDLDIQRNLAHLGAYDMLQELKAMFSKQAEQELLQTGYIDNLERLGQPVGQNLAVSLILVSLNKDFTSFVRNFNMHSMGKTVNELHAMLKLHEESLPKKDANPALHVIRAGRTPPHKEDNPGKGTICHQCVEVWATGEGTVPCLSTELMIKEEAIQELALFRKLKPGALSLYVGDGHRAAVEAIGTYHLELQVDSYVLNNCHYASLITRGVISVSRLFDDGFINRFDDNNVIFSSKDNL